jgi:hypothetical protein
VTDPTFDDVLAAARKLTPEEKALLVRSLQVPAPEGGLTREQVLAEFESRKAAGAFQHVESLRGKFAHPGLDLSFEDIQAMTHEVATDWEREMDESDGSR